MLLTKVILKDYGVYCGTNEFDFTCKKDKPVILVGGTNGAGKTTLFESIMLCLYGGNAMEKRTARKSYEQFLIGRIHRYAKDKKFANSASIIVQFKFFYDNQETEYRVDRTWMMHEAKLEEKLSISKRHSEDSKFMPLDTIEKSHWQSFIGELIPSGVARLFFFDGEKIVKIAREESEDHAIKESLQSLLGLDIVEQLRTDLKVNLVRNLTKNGASLQAEYDLHQKEKNEYVDINRRLRDRLAQKQNRMDVLQMEIESLESSISKIGGSFTSQREKAKNEIIEKKAKFESIKKLMQEQCAGTLPFSLIPAVCGNLAKQIEQDGVITQKKMGDALLESEISKIRSNIDDEKFWKDLELESDTRKKLQKKLASLLHGRDKTSNNQTEMFGFSTLQSSRILNMFDDSFEVFEKFAENSKRLAELSEEIERLERLIVNAASDDEIGPLISKLSVKHSESGELRSEMDHIDEKMLSNTAAIKQLDAKMRNLVSNMYDNNKTETKVELTKNIQKVLKEFSIALKTKKLKILEEYVLEATQTLMHKQHFIEKVIVDPETFEVRLYGQNNAQIPKNMLSEGEKQMLATAILWALAKTSGRPLPFMIDTPLARLDERHRTNIIKKFLPSASHQVLIFSTDKEIEYDYYKMLKPYLTRAYVMEFDPLEGATKKHDGYFWNFGGEKIVAV